MKIFARLLAIAVFLFVSACSVQEVQQPPPPAPKPSIKPLEVPVPKPAYRPKTDAYKENRAAKAETLDSKTRIVISEETAAGAAQSEVGAKPQTTPETAAANAADDAELERESDKLDPYANDKAASPGSENGEQKLVLASNDTNAQDEPNLAEKAQASEVEKNSDVVAKEPSATDDNVEETSPAVMSLMIQSRVDVIAGRYDAAVEKLERGLRIEPENPDLWNKLAEINLQQENYDQAVTMAEKSLQLTEDANKELKRRNQNLIIKARKRQGNAEAVKASESQAKP